MHLPPDSPRRATVNRPANEAELAATKENLAQLEQDLGVALPSDYVAFMRQHNGGVWHGEGVGLIVWSLDEVGLPNLAGTHFTILWPGLLVFATNGANEFFAFDTRQAGWPVVVFPGDVEDEDQVMPVAATFARYFDARMKGWSVGDPPVPG